MGTFVIVRPSRTPADRTDPMALPDPGLPTRVFRRLNNPERRHLAEVLRTETVGGALLMAFALAALIWANSPWKAAYETLRDTHVGVDLWHLNLTLGHWSADFLLAIFFLIAGIELKHELQVGDLSDIKAAIVPVVAAVCGMAMPVVVYLLVSVGASDAASGWAIPTATDIAFALAVLAVIGQNLPSALRAFLLTLAVVDDLGAIIIIATVYTETIDFPALAIGVALLVVFYILQRKRVTSWWIYVPLGLAIWIAIHSSGIHATVAGVAMGLLMRVTKDTKPDGTLETKTPGDHVDHVMRPISSGIGVPLFALFSAGVTLSGSTFNDMLHNRVPIGIAAGLFIGKSLGIFGGAYATARFTRAELSDDLQWRDVFAVSVLAGVGFTVSLLISELAYATDEHLLNLAKASVLVGSLVSALVAIVLLRRRDRFYDQLCLEEESDQEEVPA
jgi:NhaA family Na+:H+ antiporter